MVEACRCPDSGGVLDQFDDVLSAEAFIPTAIAGDPHEIGAELACVNGDDPSVVDRENVPAVVTARPRRRVATGLGLDRQRIRGNVRSAANKRSTSSRPATRPSGPGARSTMPGTCSVTMRRRAMCDSPRLCAMRKTKVRCEQSPRKLSRAFQMAIAISCLRSSWSAGWA
jgi:hypothetical protein